MEYRIWNIESGKSKNSLPVRQAGKFAVRPAAEQIPNTNSGFTLVEIILVVVLVAVCGFVISDMFIGQNRIYKVQTAELGVTSDARSALDDINNYVRQANSVLDSYSSYTAGPQVLILQISAVSVSDQLLPDNDIVVFYLSGSNLYSQVFPNASSVRQAITKKLASSVNSLNFTYDNVDYAQVTEIIIDLTNQQNAGVQSRAITVSSKAILRNK